MASPLGRVEHEVKKWECFEMSIRGFHNGAIAKKLKLNINTVCEMVKEALAETKAERLAQGMSDLERAIAEQDATITAMWASKTHLAHISQAYERKHKLLGLLRDQTEVSGTVTVIRQYDGWPDPASE